MIDINKSIRVAITNALSGLTSDGAPVYCYSEINPNDENVYIILTGQTEEDNSNKGAFNTNGTILLDIVHHSIEQTDYTTVDSIAGKVMQTLQPSPQTNTLTLPNNLQLTRLRRESSNTITLTLPEGNIMRRLLRYQYSVREI